MNYTERAKKLKVELEALHAAIDEVVADRLYAAAADIAGVPVSRLKDIFVKECHSAYCRCRAIRNIAANDDGL